MHQRMADAAAVGFAGERIGPLPRGFAIRGADFLRIYFDFLMRLQVMETRGVDTGQIQFLWMHDVQQENFKLPMHEPAQGLERHVRVIPEIRQHDEPPAFLEQRIAFNQRAGGAGGGGRHDYFKFGDQIVQMTAGSAGREKTFYLFREQNERGFVALVNHQIGKRGGNFGGENIFRFTARAGVTHRGADIHQQVNHHVGFRLVLADEQAPPSATTTSPSTKARSTSPSPWSRTSTMERRTWSSR